ncbi:flagellar hook-basal body complex protein FliE [Curvibacter lanceolatus]|uniref:flagellar hook-basal body complex protein FliE n=1 Tax=Curvibacter lanceolatus TaxID=86182 RepID=UPI0003AA06C9|nr:flagellar hook-basal body complex protein FliE [Curvibacter lanceolatus]
MAPDTGLTSGNAMTQDLLQIKAHAQALEGTSNGIGGAESDAQSSGPGFAQRMADALRQVNQQDRAADEKMAAVDTGASDDLVGAMLASQEAGLSFSMLMQVRNKVMGAVEELVKLPL